MKLYVLTAIPYSDLKTITLRQKSPQGFKAKMVKDKKIRQEGCISTKEVCAERAAAYDPKVWRVTVKRCSNLSKYRKKKAY
jgi:hypothetical protein